MTGERGPEGAATACVQYVLWADGLMRGWCAEREEPGGRTEPTPSERGHRGYRKRRKCRETLGSFRGYMHGCNTED